MSNEKAMFYNVDGNQCLLVQASPESKTLDIFINGRYKGFKAIRELIEEFN